MSYARFGAGGSDVYVYLDVGGYLNCCGCSLNDTSFHAFTTDEMLAHLRAHREAGHTVLDDTMRALADDAVENDHWLETGEDL